MKTKQIHNIDKEIRSLNPLKSCPNCAGHMVKAGKNHVTRKGRFQKYKCSSCGTVRLGEQIKNEV